MLEVKLYDLGYCKDEELTRVICVSKYKENYVFSYNKKREGWEIPGGHIEEGETEIQTALREVKEEVGIDVKIIDEKYRYETRYIIEDKQIDKTCVFFIAEPTNNNAKIINQEEEIEDSKWVTVEEAYKTLTFDNNKEVLKKAYDDMVENYL